MTRDELLKTSEPYAMLVAEYLRKYAEANKWKKIEESQKTVDECCNYIVQQAKRIAKGAKAIMVADEHVYNWAIEFYEDFQEMTPEEQKKFLNTNNHIQTKVPVEAPKKAEKPKSKTKKKLENDDNDNMFKLFDL